MVKQSLIIITLLIGLSSCSQDLETRRSNFKRSYEKSFEKLNKDPVKVVMSYSDKTIVLKYNFKTSLSRTEFKGYAQFVFDVFLSLYKRVDYDMNKRLNIDSLRVIILDKNGLIVDQYKNILNKSK